MKKWIIMTMVLTCITLTQTSSAQTKNTNEVHTLKDKLTSSQQPTFSCQHIIQNSETGVMTLTENVSVNTEKFKVAKAGKVVYDEKSKKITVYDCKEFTMAGRIVAKTDTKKSNVIEYTIGEDTAYML